MDGSGNLAGGKRYIIAVLKMIIGNQTLKDIETKITSRTKGIVIINLIIQQVRSILMKSLKRHCTYKKYDLVIMADEIYDRILYDGVTHTPMCTITNDCLVLT